MTDRPEPTPATPPRPRIVPCPACRRADQAGLAPGEQHADCAGAQPLGGALPSGIGATEEHP